MEETAQLGYYEQLAKEWRMLTPEEQQAWREFRARDGLVIRDGREFSYRVETVNARGEISTMLHPMHWRDMARAGREDAVEFCEKRGIPWQMPDGEFRLWCARWLHMQAEMVRQTKSLPPAAPGPTRKTTSSPHRGYRAGPGADSED